MKWQYRQEADPALTSRPARGAWIEILVSVHGYSTEEGRAPQGARGLKSLPRLTPMARPTSRPARGAWIEISLRAMLCTDALVAPRKGRVD